MVVDRKFLKLLLFNLLLLMNLCMKVTSIKKKENFFWVLEWIFFLFCGTEVEQTFFGGIFDLWIEIRYSIFWQQQDRIFLKIFCNFGFLVLFFKASKLALYYFLIVLILKINFLIFNNFHFSFQVSVQKKNFQQDF